MSRTCPDCGVALEPDEQFCGNCGCYLEWSDEPSAPVDEPAAAPAAVPPPPPPSRRTSSPPPPPPPPPPVQAQALVAPVDQPGPQQPAARRPGHAPPPPRRMATRPTEPLEPGDLVCGTCGTGNKPTRKFCRRCGETLAEAVVAKVPWFRRVLRRRPPKVTEAGSRPRAPIGSSARTTRARRPFPTRLVAVLGLLAVLGIGTFTLRGSVLGAVDAVRDRVQGVERVVPSKATASSAQEGHGAGLVRDGTQDKYWAPADPGPGRGEFVETTFARPERLVYVLVTPGVTASDEELFQQQGRPAELRITMTRDDGTTEVETVGLEDKRGAAKVSLGTSDVVRVRFEVLGSHAGNVEGSRTAIAELEFFVRK